jgi:hypothetical protein
MVLEQSLHIRFGVFWRGGPDHNFHDEVGRQWVFNIASPTERLFAGFSAAIPS